MITIEITQTVVVTARMVTASLGEETIERQVVRMKKVAEMEISKKQVVPVKIH